MSDDELENLRAILSRANSTPEKPGILETLRRVLARFFTRPKKSAGRAAGDRHRKKNAA